MLLTSSVGVTALARAGARDSNDVGHATVGVAGLGLAGTCGPRLGGTGPQVRPLALRAELAEHLRGTVVAAAAGGARAAASANADLVAEDVRDAVAARRQPLSPTAEREVSELALGGRRHGL